MIAQSSPGITFTTRSFQGIHALGDDHVNGSQPEFIIIFYVVQRQSMHMRYSWFLLAHSKLIVKYLFMFPKE